MGPERSPWPFDPEVADREGSDCFGGGTSANSSPGRRGESDLHQRSSGDVKITASGGTHFFWLNGGGLKSSNNSAWVSFFSAISVGDHKGDPRFGVAVRRQLVAGPMKNPKQPQSPTILKGF